MADVTLVMGKAIETDMAAMAMKLRELNLEQYEQALIEEQGYDSIETLNEMSAEELNQLADDCKMKPGHKKKFIAAFSNRTVANSPVAPKTKPAEPAVDTNLIALREQNAELMKQMEAVKAQQSADQMKKELEEREQKIKVCHHYTPCGKSLLTTGHAFGRRRRQRSARPIAGSPSCGRKWRTCRWIR